MGIHPHFDLKAKQMNNQYKLQSQHTYHPTNRYMNTTTQNYSGTPDTIANQLNPNQKVQYMVVLNNSERAIYLKNFDCPQLLDIKSSTMTFDKAVLTKNGLLSFKFKTDGNRHTVCITNEGILMHEFDLQ